MYDLTASEKANKSALLIVHARYSAQLAPFVKNSKTRYNYVQDALAQIIADVCEETGADTEWITERFSALETVLEKPKGIKTEELKAGDPDTPYTTNSDPPMGDIKKDDVADRGEVVGLGREEAIKADATQDLSEETTLGETEVDNKTACFRCGAELGNKISKVCRTCNSELLKLALPQPDGTDGTMGIGAGAEGPGVQELPQPINPSLPYSCKLCGSFEGSPDEVRAHINTEHGDVLRRQQELSTENMGQDNLGVTAPLASTKEASTPYGEPCPKCGGPNAIISKAVNGEFLVCPDCNYSERIGDYKGDYTGDMGRSTPAASLASAKEAWTDWPTPEELPVLLEELRAEDPGLAERMEAALEKLGIIAPTMQGLAATRTADVPQPDDDAAQVQPLPQNPGDRFDDYVQKLAETAAARKFSQLTDEDIHSIASQIGQSPDDVKNMIKVVAVFGDQVGVNGQLGGDPTPPDGYQEVSAQGLSGQQDTHDALVPTDLIMNAVADDMNMSADLAYNMVKDKYGADLPDKYHASIGGQVHYYLPAEMAAQQQQPMPQQQQQVGPTAPPAPQMSAPQQYQQPLQPTM